MKNKLISHGIAMLLLLFTLTACEDKKPAKTAAVSDESTILYDAIQNVLKGEALNKDGEWKKALGLFEKVIVQHGKSANPNLQEEVANAMLQKGLALQGLKRGEKAIQAYNALINRFADAKNTQMQALVANAMLNKSYAYNELKDVESEAKTYEEIIAQFASSTNAHVRQHLDVAYNNKGFGLILQAKQTWNDNNARVALLNQALAAALLAAQAQSIETKAMGLGNVAYAKWLLGRTDEAKAPLKEALKLSGEWLYEGELSDTKLHTVPADTGFVALLEKAWSEVKPKAKSKDAEDSKPDDTKSKVEKKSTETIHI